MNRCLFCACACTLLLPVAPAAGIAVAQPQVPLYGIHEILFEGPTCSPTDAPARDVLLTTQWQHTTTGVFLSVTA